MSPMALGSTNSFCGTNFKVSFTTSSSGIPYLVDISYRDSSTIPVFTNPGKIALQVTLCFADSRATVLVSPICAALAAQYPTFPTPPTLANPEQIWIILPHFYSFIWGKHCWIVWNHAETWIAKWSSHFSTGNFSIGAECTMPALFTSISISPRLVFALSIAW